MSAWRERASLVCALAILVVSLANACAVVAAALSAGYGPGCLLAAGMVSVAMTIFALSILACGDTKDCLRASVAGLAMVAVATVAASELLLALGLGYAACAGMAYIFRPDAVRTSEAQMSLRRQA